MRDTVPEFKEQSNIFTNEINHFVDCCINGTECICKLDEAVAVMEVVDAIYESAKTGKPVIINE